MRELIPLLAAFAEAVAARRTHEFEPLVTAAYEAGARLEDLLTALEIGRLVGEPPQPVVTEASATAHLWQWRAVRLGAADGALTPRAAGRGTGKPCTTR